LLAKGDLGILFGFVLLTGDGIKRLLIE